jgi:hypothetical protein
MSEKWYRIVFPVILSLILFSLWVVFALLIINKFYYETLPGYGIGKLCIWDLGSLIVALIIAYFIIKKWGSIEIDVQNGQKRIILNQRYFWLFSIYFLIIIGIGIWQFVVFSQQF